MGLLRKCPLTRRLRLHRIRQLIRQLNRLGLSSDRLANLYVSAQQPEQKASLALCWQAGQ